ncbi:MAG: bacteriohemerythrin [Acidobacteriia bacterium]|nr:bacteriohemerythrin [Terriglobia bacterium]
MAVPIWNESFSVKVKRCDEDHKKLLDIIQRLHDSVIARHGEIDTKAILAELVDYTETHFKTEEGMLEQTKFPGLERHCQQHETFKAKLEELKQSMEYAPGDTPMAILQYLKNWLVRHIKMVDCQYSAHLNANGIH